MSSLPKHHYRYDRNFSGICYRNCKERLECVSFYLRYPRSKIIRYTMASCYMLKPELRFLEYLGRLSVNLCISGTRQRSCLPSITIRHEAEICRKIRLVYASTKRKIYSSMRVLKESNSIQFVIAT